MNTVIRNARIIDPANQLDRTATLYIVEGRIAAFDEAPAGFTAQHDIDANGLIAIPGLVDLSVRLREPGYEYKATLESEMYAAVSGGVTSLALPPDTDPPLDEPGLVEMLKHRARRLQQAHVYPIGALTVKLQGEQLTEMAELRDAGCVAFSQADAPIVNLQALLRALEYAATFDFSVWLRPQDPHLSRDGVAHDGAIASRLGLPGIPACAETVAIATRLLLAKETGARLHFCRLSTAAGIDMVRQAKRQGLPVTCDVAVHHLHLTENDIGFFDANCHVIPPFRNQQDLAAIRQGLLDGTIDAICSDHTPVDDDAKHYPFGESEAGATAVELLLPLTLKWAREANVPLAAALSKITSAPAGILGQQTGQLSPGMRADIALFDPEAWWQVTPARLHSQGKNTPFLGLEVPGEVHYTLVSGNPVYRRAD